MTPSRIDLDDSAVVDDSRGGLAMFLIFTAAVLIVTGAVAIVALVGSWWILGVAFAVHVLMTAVVIATIWAVMSGRAAVATDSATPDTADSGRAATPAPLPADGRRPGPRVPPPTRPAAAL